jgi:O-antigen/teichoic acid export membrane protein
MSNQAASYRRILKVSSIMGGASIINILIGVVRTKILALLLGPMGVGTVGLYMSLISTVSAVASMGIGIAGVRQVADAEAKEDKHTLSVVMRAMFWGVLLLASAATMIVWSFREMLAFYVLGSAEKADIVSWLSLAVGLSVASFSQGALLQGMRQISDMARWSVYNSVLNTVLGLTFLWQWGAKALLAYVLIGPLVNFILGHWFVSRLPKLVNSDISLQEIRFQWQTLLRIGVPFMGAGLVGSLVELWIRIVVGNTLGAASLGHFQAAWMISMQYISFVLGAMTADYFPRLTSVIHKHKAATRMVNEQIEVALLLSAPIFIAVIGLTSWVVNLLYSSEFMPATDVLRWQILGDVLKVASWPLSWVIVAAGASKTSFGTESFAFLMMGGVVAGFASRVGLQITGIAFLFAYVAYLPLVYWLAKRRINFKWQPNVLRLLLSILGSCILVAILSARYWWGAFIATGLSLTFGIYTLIRLAHMSGAGGLVGRIADFGHCLLARFGVKHD